MKKSGNNSHTSEEDTLCTSLAYCVLSDGELLYNSIKDDEYSFLRPSLMDELITADLDEKAERIVSIAKKYNTPQMKEEGILCAAHYLSPLIPYSFGKYINLTDPAELPELWRKYGYLAGAEYLTKESFKYWMQHCDPEKAYRLGILQATKASPAEIAYSLFPRMSFDFQTKKGSRDSERTTPEEIGNYLNNRVAEYIKSGKRPTNLSEFNLEKGGRIISYLKTHSDYARLGNELSYNLGKRENWARGTHSPYDVYIDVYRAIKMLGNAPYYELPDGKKVKSLNELRVAPTNAISEAMRKGYLDDWISIFFQEDPNKTFHSQEAFAKETIRMMDYIKSLLVSYPPSVKFSKALNKIDSQSKNYRKRVKFSFRGILLKFLFAPLAFLSLILVVGFAIEFLLPDSKVLPGWLCWGYAAVILGVVIYFIAKLWRVYELTPGYTYVFDLGNPGFEMRELDALKQAFSGTGYSQLEACINSYKYNRSQAQNSQFGYCLGCIFTSLLLLIGLFLISPSFGAEKSLLYDSVNPGPKLAGTYEGKIDNKTNAKLSLDSITGFRVDSARFTVKNQHIILAGNIDKKKKTLYVVELTPSNPADSLSSWWGLYRLEINTEEKTCSGVYLPYQDSKSEEIIPKEIELTITSNNEEKDNSDHIIPSKNNKKNRKSQRKTKAETEKQTGPTTSEPTPNEEPVQEENRGIKYETVDIEDLPTGLKETLKNK